MLFTVIVPMPKCYVQQRRTTENKQTYKKIINHT